MTRLEAIWGMIILGLMFSMAEISAFPYQLNLTDGTLIDLNTTNHTDNITIYIIHQYTNATTNITYINNTCMNCTYINQSVSNLTQSNITYVSYASYNKSEVDTKISEVDAALRGLLPGYAPASTADSLSSRIKKLEDKKVESSSNSWLWVAIVVLGIGLVFIFYMIYFGGRD